MREEIRFNADKTVSIQVGINIFEDGDVYIGEAPSLNISTHGVTKEEAEAMVKEAINMWMEDCLEHRTLEEALLNLGWKKHPESAATPWWEIPERIHSAALLHLAVPA